MQTDVLIIGSGMGGATTAAALAPTGVRITILERGDYLQDTPATRDAQAIFHDGIFRSTENWNDPTGRSFNPGNYACVGGNSKFYGAVLFRYRAEDFSELQHLGGVSPAWPVTYQDFEPWYQQAETLYQVRGGAGEDPTEPPHSGDYAFAPVPHEPVIENAAARLAAQGLTPSHLPLGVDIDAWLEGGLTGWDAHPNTGTGKKDAESVGLASALRYNTVTLETGCTVTRLIAAEDGHIEAVEYRQKGQAKRAGAKLVILSAGAVNSAALLLKSANQNYPTGLANRSDQVGRNFMNHNTTALMSLHPSRRNPSIYQKTLYFNDFYLAGGAGNAPLGNVQLLGKITPDILSAQVRLPQVITRWIAERSIDWYAMSEDLPDPQSRVTVKGDQIILDWKRSNWDAHQQLVHTFKRLLRKAGWPIVLSRAFDRSVPSHQCGTVRFGVDPATSALDPFCRAHDHRNLFVVDASFLPNSAAVNPALTIAAQALRAADHIKSQDLAA